MDNLLKFSEIIAILILMLFPFQSYSGLYNKDEINIKGLQTTSDHLFFTDPIDVVTDEGLMENALWPIELCFIDLNNNNYPEIVAGTRERRFLGEDNYMRGLHSFEYNGSGGFDHFYQPMNFSGGLTRINLDRDEYPDMVSNQWVLTDSVTYKQGFFIRNIEGNLSLKNWTFDVPNDDRIRGFEVGDLNADGRYDFITKSDTFNWDGIYTALCRGNETFSVGKWDEGLPRYNNSDPNHSPKISVQQYGLFDLNNDGWLDICSATGNGGSIMVKEPCQYYNWISDGKGNWTDFSRNFPTYEEGINIAVADIDNDCDLDMVLTTKKTYEGGEIAHYLFENDQGKNWIRRDFPDEFSLASTGATKNDIFEDVDGDGNVDFIMIEMTPNYDDNGDEINCTDTVWVAFGNGDWTWNIVRQGSIDAGFPNKIYLVDIDLDGDKDLVFSYHSGPLKTKDTLNGIVCFFNTQIDKDELLFTEKPVSTHLRGGSIQHFGWTLTTSDDPKAMNDIFNLSISYTGIEGPYFSLKSGLKRWWTDLIIPAVPSNNVYFKLVSEGATAVIGPYFIHNEEGLTSFVTLNQPDDGEFFFSGDEMELNFSTSKIFEDESVEIKLKHESNLFILGNIPIGKEETSKLIWKVPEEFEEGLYNVFFDFSYQGRTLSQSDGTVLHLVPNSSLPEKISLNNTHIPLGQCSKIDIFVKAFNGTEISSLCQYHLFYNPDIMEIYDVVDGSFMVKPLELGPHNITIIASIFSREIYSVITISVHKPITILDVQYPSNPVLVGNVIRLRLSALDENEKTWLLENHEFNVTVDGNYSDLVKDYPFVDLVATKPGFLKINISVVQTRIFKVMEIRVLPFLSNVTIKPSRNIYFLDETINVNIIVDDINGDQIDEGLMFDTSIIGSCEYTANSSHIEIIPATPGVLSLIIKISRFNETIFLNRTFTVIEGLGDLVPDRRIKWVEVGKPSVFQFLLFDSSGTVDLYDYCIVDCNTSNIIEIGIRSNNSLSIVGKKPGDSVINITIEFYGRLKSYSFKISSENCPRTLEIDVPSIIFNNMVHSLPFIVKNSLGDEITDYDIDVTSCSITSFVQGNIVELCGNEVGNGWIEVNVSNRDVYKVLRREIDIFPEMKSIFTQNEDYIDYMDQTIEIRPKLMDVEGNLYTWNNWTVKAPGGVEITQINDVIQLSTSVKIDDKLIISLDHFGVSFSKKINISFIPNSIIKDIVVKYSTDSGFVEAIVIDQYGNNVTRYCNFNWIGDFERLESYKVRTFSDSIKVEVSLNGTTRIKNINLSSNNNQISPLFLIAIVSSVIIVILIALYIRGKMKTQSRQNIVLNSNRIGNNIAEE